MLDNTLLQQLLDHTVGGDQQAFRRLYDLSGPYLHALARKMLRDSSAADDVVQEAYLQIWRGAREYSAEKGSVIAWMAGIARNRALDRLRRDQSQRDRIQAASLQPQLDIIDDPQAQAQLSEEARKLLDCLKPIQAEQRNSILLAFFHGLSHSEIAKNISVPVGTVKSWIRRGLAAVRECLQL